MEGIIYKRDGRAPIPDSEVTSKIMSSIKYRNTKPELIVRKALWANGVRGYRVHWGKIPGTPDISFPGKKIAIFINEGDRDICLAAFRETYLKEEFTEGDNG